MNIDKKLELAHEWSMWFLDKNKDMAFAPNTVAYNAWQYVDAMEDEYNKRKQQKTVEDISQDIGLFLNMADSPQLEFQVDWSVAPDWADWWALGSLTGQGVWSKTKPVCVNINGVNYWDVGALVGEEHMSIAPSFNYCGDWKDSLRKRPK